MFKGQKVQISRYYRFVLFCHGVTFDLEQTELSDPHVTMGWGWAQWKPRLKTSLETPEIRPDRAPEDLHRGTFKWIQQLMHQVLQVKEEKRWFFLKHEKVTRGMNQIKAAAGLSSVMLVLRRARQQDWEEGRWFGVQLQLSAEPTGWKVHLSAAILSVCLSLSLSITVSPLSPPPVTIIPIFYHFLCPPPHHPVPLLLYLLPYLFLLKSV